MICTCSRGDKKPGSDHQTCINQAAEFQTEIKRLTEENRLLKVKNVMGRHIGYCPVCDEPLITNESDIIIRQITCNNADCDYIWSYQDLVKDK